MIGLNKWVEGGNLYVDEMVIIAQYCKGCQSGKVDKSPEQHVGESFFLAVGVIGVAPGDGEVLGDDVGKQEKVKGTESFEEKPDKKSGAIDNCIEVESIPA